jgi:hypothetical protein
MVLWTKHHERARDWVEEIGAWKQRHELRLQQNVPAARHRRQNSETNGDLRAAQGKACGEQTKHLLKR